MHTGYIVSSVIEISIAILLIIGLLNEKKIARWEGKLFVAIKQRFKLQSNYKGNEDE